MIELNDQKKISHIRRGKEVSMEQKNVVDLHSGT